MTTSPAETKAALLESAVARVRERLEGDEADDVERFVRAYYANAAPDDLVGRNDLDVYGAAMAHWRLARLRRPGELKVHVYNPNVEEHGWESPYTVVETVIADMPFLVDSVTMEVTRHGSAMHLVARPIMRLRRDEEGRLLEVGGEDGKPESLIHVEIDRITDPDALERLRADLERVLGDVAAAVEDWQAMRAEVHEAIAEIEQSPPPIPEAELDEARALLQWMHDDHFTFLGYREYEIRTRGRRGRARLGRRDRPRHPPRHGRAAPLAQLLEADAGGAQARAREDPAQPDQGELAGDRPPAGLSRLRRREALRRVRRGDDRSAASSASSRTPSTARARGRSRCCGGRCRACSSAPACCPAATTTRR